MGEDGTQYLTEMEDNTIEKVDAIESIIKEENSAIKQDKGPAGYESNSIRQGGGEIIDGKSNIIIEALDGGGSESKGESKVDNEDYNEATEVPEISTTTVNWDADWLTINRRL